MSALFPTPLALWMACALCVASSGQAASLDFNRDVRPILSEHCFNCHGFDDNTRKARLRLDERDAALVGGRSGKASLVPGHPDQSELWARVISTDPDELMPPPETGKVLTTAEKEILRTWIEQGAVYAGHWAFEVPQRPALPTVSDPSWPRNGIDFFTLARMDAAGVKPRPEAPRTTLIRRATLDLTGLPPTPDEIDAFLADESDAAYERLVDRLLSSAHYGERMAVEWLDAARYADTHGYHIDSARDMTAWRDWVIRAFNDNKPFDRFTIEQVAGDLLPDATVEQKVASGFNRNHMINYEGGAIPEEYLAAYIMDRINTTSTVWLGLTMACAQCHDHKYDPITMKDYYSFYALFHNVPERGLDGVDGNAAPLLRLPTEEQSRELAAIDARIRALEEEQRALDAALDEQVKEWARAWDRDNAPEWSVIEPQEVVSKAGQVFERQADGSWLTRSGAPAQDRYRLRIPLIPGNAPITGLRLEVLPDDSLPHRGPGRHSNGNFVLTSVEVRRTDTGSPLKVARATATHSQEGYPISAALDPSPTSGWAILPQTGRPQEAVFSLETAQGQAKETPGTGSFLEWDFIFGSGFSQHQFARFRVSVTTAPDPHDARSLPAPVLAALAIPAGERSPEDVRALRDHYRKEVSAGHRQVAQSLKQEQESRRSLERSFASVMVMSEMETPRETRILVRGEYDKKGEPVEPGTPAALPPLKPDWPRNRLGLAYWLVDPDQPLTARVTVNRFWQMIFGQGLVASSENFGSQADWPTHPELLDWLAREFVDSGWNVKAFQKRILMSATYRQDSRAPRENYEEDPENQLYARGPRHRLHAEFVRDLALHASGLLNPRIGGESVFPYQPAGLWEELMSRLDNARFTAQTYVQDSGDKLYRRSMYTFIKRTSPHPMMSTLDAPDRQVCSVRRPRTNTPLQALILLNDPTFVEAARKLAERVLVSAGNPADRLVLAFRLTTGRSPTPAEMGVLEALLADQASRWQQDPDGALALLSVGESPRNPTLDPVQVASWTVLANTLLNLDETITKN